MWERRQDQLLLRSHRGKHIRLWSGEGENESGRRERDEGRVKFQLSLTFPPKKTLCSLCAEKDVKNQYHFTGLLCFTSSQILIPSAKVDSPDPRLPLMRSAKNDFYFFYSEVSAGSGVFVVLSSPQDGVSAWRSTCTGFHSFLVFFFCLTAQLASTGKKKKYFCLIFSTFI